MTSFCPSLQLRPMTGHCTPASSAQFPWWRHRSRKRKKRKRRTKWTRPPTTSPQWSTPPGVTLPPSSPLRPQCPCRRDGTGQCQGCRRISSKVKVTQFKVTWDTTRRCNIKIKHLQISAVIDRGRKTHPRSNSTRRSEFVFVICIKCNYSTNI